MSHDLVKELYWRFRGDCARYLPPASVDRIHEAYTYARAAHGSQKRKSGEPYITHPITVANYLAQLYLDETALIGALLHDVAEDTEKTLEDIEARFGTQTRRLVDGVTRLSGVGQLEDMAHLFTAMASDVRVVLIKLYDRLHNMQTLGIVPPDHQRRKAQETQRIYVPLAAKFGIWRLKKELETLILRYSDPIGYKATRDMLDEHCQEHLPRLERLKTEIQMMLRQDKILSSIYVEPRSPYRIYETNRQHLFDSTFKPMLRLIVQVDDVGDCYRALGCIHKNFAHLSNNLEDFIGNPRDIFYRSIHTTIMVPRYSPVDIRIRTYEFDKIAQIGVVAQLQFAPPNAETRPSFLPDLQRLSGEFNEPQKFIETVFQDILQKHIRCFTPRGREISLPRGATVLDFAYQVHTDIGHECRGGLVNGKAVDLNHVLADGDHVEIIRSRRPEPHLEWLDDTLGHAVTFNAKRKIREWLRRQDSETLIRQGREALNRLRRRFNVLELSVSDLADEFDLPTVEALHLAMGNGTITISEVVKKFLIHVPDLFLEANRRYIEVVDHMGQKGRLISIDEREMKLAHCCRPLVGDQIVGYVSSSKEQPIRVHRANCRLVKTSLHSQHFAQLEWIQGNAPLYMVHIRLEGYDRAGLLRDMSIPIAQAGANIAEIDSYDNQKNFIIRIKLELSSEDQLIRIIHRLGSLQNVRYVQRIKTSEIEHWRAKA